VIEGHRYTLMVECYFPRRSYEKAPILLNLNHDSNVYISGDLSFSARLETKNLLIVPEKAVDSSIKISYSDDEVRQNAKIKLRVRKEPLSGKLRRNKVWLCILIFFSLIYMLMGYYINGINGAFSYLITLIAVIFIPEIISRLLQSFK